METYETLLGRRQALKCLGWAGTGALYALNGGIATSLTLDQAVAGVPPGQRQAATTATFTFLQISDTHVGFAKAANPDPVATLRETVAKIRALPVQPDFLVHTGDISHLAKTEQFDLAQQVLGEIGLPIHFVPGEHDLVDGNDPRPYIARFAPEAKGNGWYSFDVKGVHFVALVNVVQLGSKSMGTLGAEQLAWLKEDLAGFSSSTPIVVLSHFPLWALYPDWGWGTEDGATALALLRRFGSISLATCWPRHRAITRRFPGLLPSCPVTGGRLVSSRTSPAVQPGPMSSPWPRRRKVGQPRCRPDRAAIALPQHGSAARPSAMRRAKAACLPAKQ